MIARALKRGGIIFKTDLRLTRTGVGERGVNRKYLLIAVACLLVAGTLAALFLLGFLEAPLNPGIIEVEAITWNMTRPEGWGETAWVELNDIVLNSYASHNTFIKLELDVYELGRPSDYYEQMIIGFNATATVTEGFIHSLRIKFDTESPNASVDIYEDPDSFKTRNVEIRQIVDDEGEYFVDAQALGKPESCKLKMQLYWLLFDRNTADQTMVATLEATYFNGTAYEKAVIPIRLSAFASSD